MMQYNFWYKSYAVLIAACAILCSNLILAQTPLLSADAAFPIQVESVSANTAQISWDIPEDYYLYQHKIQVQQGHEVLKLNLPVAQDLDDENYGQTQVYYHQVNFEIPTQVAKKYQVIWQGCAKDRICYPPQKIEFKTDLNGLVSVGIGKTTTNSLLELNQKIQNDHFEEVSVENSTHFAADEVWLNRLSEKSFLYSIFLFLGLGILLAFTPCSLPMLPILSSVIVRDRKGLQAWLIALVFVLSMASIYAVLGLIASSAGLNFQRWLQQPMTLIAFATLFVLFALNLFGLFELKLPRAVVQRLDHVQGMQRGGTLVGAAVMGVLSALLVGPCMTAPLAGALLFISQTQNQWHGAVLLFCLGFGMGMPLLLVSILGSRVLPKAGQWMQQVKIIFAFLMLGLALYFVRPLLHDFYLQVAIWGLVLGLIAYISVFLIQRQSQWKWLFLIVMSVILPCVVYQQMTKNFQINTHLSASNIVWQHANNAVQLQQLLSQASPHQPIIIDVYADWCIACQPIEKKILKQQEVQAALRGYTLIKLDLSQYDESHQALLNTWNILGPPTFLFLNAQQKEQRHLRLTGSFTREQLLAQIAALAP